MLYFARYSAGICAAAILSGCNGSQPPLPALATPAQARATASWMSPEAKGENLLYVADLGTNSVDVFPYPKGKQVGAITGFGSVATLCVDKAGDVFVVDEAGPVNVFAHGGTTPIRKLPATGAPDGCSVDPATGNLAVTNESSYLYGTIAIYAKAKGNPKPYFNDTVDATFFCGYDDKGNLFIDGWDRFANPIFLEMPKGKKNVQHHQDQPQNPRRRPMGRKIRRGRRPGSRIDLPHERDGPDRANGEAARRRFSRTVLDPRLDADWAQRRKQRNGAVLALPRRRLPEQHAQRLRVSDRRDGQSSALEQLQRFLYCLLFRHRCAGRHGFSELLGPERVA